MKKDVPIICKKKVMLLMLIGILALTACATSDSHGINVTKLKDINTSSIGNLSQGALVTADNEYVYFSQLYTYKENLKNGEVTFLCNNPTCIHDIDCASANKKRLQIYSGQLYASGNAELKSGNIIEYSSFGKIVDGEYQKIVEKNANIMLPTIIDNVLLCEIDNNIQLIDLTTKKVLKNFKYDYALYLNELFKWKNDIYFVNGIGTLNRISLESGKTEQITNKKVKIALPTDQYMYFTSNKDELFRMGNDGKLQLITEKCATYNIAGDKLYVAYNNKEGAYIMDLDGKNQRQIFNEDSIVSIYIFENQKKIVLSGYEKSYMGTMDIMSFEELQTIEPADYEVDMQE